MYKKLFFIVAFVFVAYSSESAISRVYYDTLDVANGTETTGCVPIYGDYVNNLIRSRFVYPASMLKEMARSTIYGMTFCASSFSAGLWNILVVVRMREIPDSLVPDYTSYLIEDYTEFTTVWQGRLYGNVSEEWIKFDTSFNYKNGNLLVDIHVVEEGVGHSVSYYGISRNSAARYVYHDGQYEVRAWSNVLPRAKFVHSNPKYPSVCDAYTWTHSDNTQQTLNSSGIYVYSYVDSLGATVHDTVYLTLNSRTSCDIAVTACDAYTWHGTTWARGTCDTLDVANGTETSRYIPIYGSSALSNQDNKMLYPSSMLTDMIGKTIQGLAFHASSISPGLWGVTATIQLGEFMDTNTYICSGHLYDSYLYTTVWHGTLNGNVAEEWMHFPIPYKYKGGNLLVNIIIEGGENSHNVYFAGINRSFGSCLFYGGGGPQDFLPRAKFLYGSDTIFNTSQADYNRVFVNAAGCDSTATLHLVLHNSTTGDTTATACNIFSWHGADFTSDTIVNSNFPLLNSVGCDSTVTLNLTVNHTSNDSISVTACDSYLWHNNTYTTTGIYYYDNNDPACPVVDTMNLTVNSSTTRDTVAVACDGFSWHGTSWLLQPTISTLIVANGNEGNYNIPIKGYYANNPQHNQMIYPSSMLTGIVNKEIQGMSFYASSYSGSSWHINVTLRLAEVSQSSLPNGLLSDDSVNFTTVWQGILNGNVAEEWMEFPTPYVYGGGNLLVDIQFTGGVGNSVMFSGVTSPNASYMQCLLFGYIYSTNSYNFLPRASFRYRADNSLIYTSPVEYDYVTLNAVGCDSTTTLHLTVNASHTIDENVSACDSLTWHGTTYTASTNTPLYHETPEEGCGTNRLNLTIHRSTTTVDNVSACENHTWIDGQTYFSPTTTPTYMLSTHAGCDSLVTLHLTIDSHDCDSYSQTVCDGYSWHGQNFTTSGAYLWQKPQTTACIDHDTLHLTVNHSNHYVDTVTACDSYTWHGVVYAANDTVSYYYTNVYSCDSSETLLLTVNHSDSTSAVDTACNSYSWNDTIYTAGGTKWATLANRFGCDSTVALNLTVKYSSHNISFDTSCNSYQWNPSAEAQFNYNTSGTYNYPYTNDVGCPSCDTLHLMVHYSDTGDVYATVCDSFTWHGVTYTASTTAQHFTTTIHDCDSTAILHLTVNYSDSTERRDTTLQGTPFFYDGQQYAVSGDYYHTLENRFGCDSTVTLHLTVLDTLVIADTVFHAQTPVYIDTVVRHQGQLYNKISVQSALYERGCVVGGDGYYRDGQEFRLYGFANDSYRFYRWSDGVTDNPRTVTMSQGARDSGFVAEFAQTNVNGNAQIPQLESVRKATDTKDYPVPCGDNYITFHDSSAYNYYGQHIVTTHVFDTLVVCYDTLEYDGSFVFGRVNSHSANESLGFTVGGDGFYLCGMRASVAGVPYEGGAFEHWGDGETVNPRYITVDENTGQKLYMAYFSSLEGIEDAERSGVSVFADRGGIVVEGPTGSRVAVYDMLGRRIVSTDIRDSKLNIQSSQFPASGVYLVHIEGIGSRKVVVVK